MYENKITNDTFDSQDSFHRVCNRGDPEVSDFTCTLCTPIEGDITLALCDLGAAPLLIDGYIADLFTS